MIHRTLVGTLHRSAKQIVEFVVRADPHPSDRITVALADGAVLFVDAH